MKWLSGIRTRLRLLFGGRDAERRMEEEIRFHVDMEAERLEREEGLEAGEARRRALVAFGGVERTKEALRDGRGLAWLSGLKLDLKLGTRMLMKYPVLTGASVVALTIAVALATSWFEFMGDMAKPRFPLPEPDRIVLLQNQDTRTGDKAPRALHDFEEWRRSLVSVEDLAATSGAEYSVRTEDRRYATLEGARVSPSMFELTRVPSLHGRTLQPADAEPGAEAVAVLAHDVWQRLFDGDPDAVGQTLRVGEVPTTVVGVMPPDYAFPTNEQIWTPLRDRVVEHARGDGPPLTLWGRLVPGATLDEARAELEVLGRRAAADHPATHEHLRPQIMRPSLFGDQARMALLLNIPFLLFLIVVSANVATLLLARTASRQGEIALRSALGASRWRLVLQLVAEALVLTTVAGVVGLVIARWGLAWGTDLFFDVQQTRQPFWFDEGLSIRAVVYVLGLCGLGALIIGGIPALRSTRRGLRQRLMSSGSTDSMRFGFVATAVIVVQVGLTVAFVPLAILTARDTLELQAASAFPAEDYLGGRLVLTDTAASGRLFDEVDRRLRVEPGIAAVTRVSQLPGFNHVVTDLEIEGDTTEITYARQVAVDANFFAFMGAEIVSGRGFVESDARSDADVVVMDRSWAAERFPGGSPLGRRIRAVPPSDTVPPGPWLEIVGVVDGLKPGLGPAEDVAVYRPLRVAEHASLWLYMRTEGPPASYEATVHGLVESVDPRLGMAELRPLSETWRPVERSNSFFTTALAVVAAVIVFFALMGIYALMSFTVARRSCEIGIRAALGASRGRILAAIFSRAAAQVGVGIAGGAILVSLTVMDSSEGRAMVAAVSAAMLVVGLGGAWLPARRALRIQPTEALRAE